MSEIKNCPKCQVSLEGEDIYQYFLNFYTKNGVEYPHSLSDILRAIKDYPKHFEGFPSETELQKLSTVELNALHTANNYGWTKAEPKKFKKEIGIEILGYYDGIALYSCPACNHVWKRFNWVTDEVLKSI